MNAIMLIIKDIIIGVFLEYHLPKQKGLPGELMEEPISLLEKMLDYLA